VAEETPLGVPTGAPPASASEHAAAYRVRITFAKGPEIRFIGHLDVVRLWERAARRARLPLAYTQGFTPHPRFAFAAPLALGATGEGELLDAYFTETVALDELRARLAAELPPGCAVVDLTPAPLDAPALMSLVRWAEYRVETTESLPVDDGASPGAPSGAPTPGSRWTHQAPTDQTNAGRGDEQSGSTAPAAVRLLPTDAELTAIAPLGAPWRAPAHRLPPLAPPQPLPPAEEITRRISAFLASSRHTRHRERDGKSTAHDVRADVLALWLSHDRDSAPGPGGQTLVMVLRAGSDGAGRPEEVAAALGLNAYRIHRVRIGLEGDDRGVAS
jgi:hypothetical protein